MKARENDVQQLINKRIYETVSELLDDPSFRMFLGAMLVRCGLESSSYEPNKPIEYDEGRRSVGLELLRLCDAVTKNGDPMYGMRKRVSALLEYKEMEQYYYELLKGK